jgi:hypothetical protein
VAGRAADRLGDRIDQLVLIDAYVPDDGDSCWSLTSDTFRKLFIGHSIARRDPRPRERSLRAATLKTP